MRENIQQQCHESQIFFLDFIIILTLFISVAIRDWCKTIDSCKIGCSRLAHLFASVSISIDKTRLCSKDKSAVHSRQIRDSLVGRASDCWCRRSRVRISPGPLKNLLSTNHTFPQNRVQQRLWSFVERQQTFAMQRSNRSRRSWRSSRLKSRTDYW